MGKERFSKALFALMLIFLLALAACSGGTDDEPADTGGDTEEGSGGEGDEEEASGEDDGLYSIDDFSNIKTNEGEASKAGHLLLVSSPTLHLKGH